MSLIDDVLKDGTLLHSLGVEDRFFDEVAALREENALLRAEVARLKTCCTIEAMLANPNVDSLIRQHEATIKRMEGLILATKRHNWTSYQPGMWTCADCGLHSTNPNEVLFACEAKRIRGEK